VRTIDQVGVRARSRRHRFGALAFSVPHQAHGVHGERSALRFRPEHSSDSPQVRGQAHLSLAIKQVFHPYSFAQFSTDWQLFKQ
jgi:hypothetical protein